MKNTASIRLLPAALALALASIGLSAAAGATICAAHDCSRAPILCLMTAAGGAPISRARGPCLERP